MPINKNWDRVQSLFLEAPVLRPDERGVFLDRTCAGEDEHAIAEALEHTALLEPENLAVTRLGAWRVIKEIGRGGMGTVYLATRDDDQFHKRAAH